MYNDFKTDIQGQYLAVLLCHNHELGDLLYLHCALITGSNFAVPNSAFVHLFIFSNHDLLGNRNDDLSRVNLAKESVVVN